jgi:hypothetical protein
MPEIISRKEAIERGVRRYFTGKACKRGHFAERCVTSKRCSECERGRSRKGRIRNPEKAREYAVVRYWKDPERVGKAKTVGSVLTEDQVKAIFK